MTSGSMNVHSLIDKFQGSPPSDSRNPDENRPPDRGISTPSHHNQPGSGTMSNPPNYSRKDLDLLEKSGILSIVGDPSEFPLNEGVLNDIIRLKIEQERTKQQQIKLDIVLKNYSIMTTALNANIPSHMIPKMCVSPDDESLTHSHSHSRSDSQDYGLPVNFRFGAGSRSRSGSTSSTPVLGPSQPTLRRPLSPAKLGAQSVAALTSPTASYRLPTRKPPLIPHQRHFSMPVEPNRQQIDLSKIDTHLKPYQQVYLQPPVAQTQMIQPLQIPSQVSSQSTPQSTQSYKLPTRTTPSHSRSRSMASMSSKTSPIGSSTMQVKPAPAQPLQRLAKLSLPPSQESMTSFQHVIQFQHWRPEYPGQVPQNSKSSGSPERHKRHKSNADNMSVDLGPNPIIGSRVESVNEEGEQDMSMERDQ